MATVEPLVVIVGETASGKTALGIELAQKFQGEIICADSRTIYRGMDIGTAKPTAQERAAVRHHLLDIRNPDEKYSAAQFQKDAQELIKDIANRGKLPIMVGGTGLYVDSVIYNYQFPKDGDRDQVNPRHSTNPQTDRQLRDSTLILGVQRDRADLENRIRTRVQVMLDEGLVDEVQRLIQQYGRDNEAMSGIGYKFFADYLDGRLTLDEAIEKFVRGDMSLAKRQRTWFKRNKSIHWLNNRGDAVDIVTTFLSNLD